MLLQALCKIRELKIDRCLALWMHGKCRDTEGVLFNGFFILLLDIVRDTTIQRCIRFKDSGFFKFGLMKESAVGGYQDI